MVVVGGVYSTHSPIEESAQGLALSTPPPVCPGAAPRPPPPLPSPEEDFPYREAPGAEPDRQVGVRGSAWRRRRQLPLSLPAERLFCVSGARQPGTSCCLRPFPWRIPVRVLQPLAGSFFLSLLHCRGQGARSSQPTQRLPGREKETEAHTGHTHRRRRTHAQSRRGGRPTGRPGGGGGLCGCPARLSQAG